MEGWGRGLLNIVTECKAAGLPTPEFETIPDFVCLTIRFKEPLKPHLSGKSEATVKRYAKILVDANLIEYKNSNKTGGYYAK